MNEVGLLVRDVAGQPGRGAHVEVTLEISHGARTDGRSRDIRRAANDFGVLIEPELDGGSRRQRPDDVDGACEIGKLFPRQGRLREQLLVVLDVVDVAIVGDPVERNRIGRREELPGELQVQVVLRLEERLRLAVDLRPFVTQPVDVGQRLLADEAGRATGATQRRALLDQGRHSSHGARGASCVFAGYPGR